jgi:hypothetical protein
MAAFLDNKENACLNYVGCYADQNERDMSFFLMNDPSLTIALCVSKCLSNNYSYAGVQFRLVVVFDIFY